MTLVTEYEFGHKPASYPIIVYIAFGLFLSFTANSLRDIACFKVKSQLSLIPRP